MCVYGICGFLVLKICNWLLWLIMFFGLVDVEFCLILNFYFFVKVWELMYLYFFKRFLFECENCFLFGIILFELIVWLLVFLISLNLNLLMLILCFIVFVFRFLVLLLFENELWVKLRCFVLILYLMVLNFVVIVVEFFVVCCDVFFLCLVIFLLM